MPRFVRELRFWEIEVEGNTVRTRHGKIGTNGRTSKPKTFESEDAAKGHAEKRIREQKKAGFVLDDPHAASTPEGGHEELVAAIYEDPTDDGGYLVYADWLQGQGDPRGELITLQAGGHEKEEKKLLKKHPELGLPNLLEAAVKETRRRRKDDPKSGCRVVWRNGFIAEAQIGQTQKKGRGFNVREIVAELLAHQSAVFLQELRIGALGTDDYRFDYGAVTEVVARSEHPCLRTLVTADVEPHHGELGFIDLGRMGTLHALPRLSRLVLRGGTVDFGGTEIPTLEQLDLVGPLVELDVLRSLVPVSDRLKRIRLAHGALDDEAAAWLIAHPTSFRHLEHLDLEANRLSEEAVARLAELPFEVVAENQRRARKGWNVEVDDALINSFAPDSKSVSNAREYSSPKNWTTIGHAHVGYVEIVWGSGRYHTYVELTALAAHCSCPSRKYPCKHALGLLLMAASSADIPDASPGGDVLSAAQESRYGGSWE